jgi:hypothetical protein
VFTAAKLFLTIPFGTVIPHRPLWASDDMLQMRLAAEALKHLNNLCLNLREGWELCYLGPSDVAIHLVIGQPSTLYDVENFH